MHCEYSSNDIVQDMESTRLKKSSSGNSISCECSVVAVGSNGIHTVLGISNPPTTWTCSLVVTRCPLTVPWQLLLSWQPCFPVYPQLFFIITCLFPEGVSFLAVNFCLLQTRAFYVVPNISSPCNVLLSITWSPCIIKTIHNSVTLKFSINVIIVNNNTMYCYQYYKFLGNTQCIHLQAINIAWVTSLYTYVLRGL